MGIFEKITSQYKCRFDDLLAHRGETVVTAFSDKMYQGFCDHYSHANYLTYTEWLLRHYHASKKLVLAALFFTQTEFLFTRKMRNLSLYAMYYSLFSAFSSNVILLPYMELRSVRSASHTSLFSIISDHFIKYQIYDKSYIELLNELRLGREAYSYRLPLSGKFASGKENALNLDFLFPKLSELLPIIFQTSELISYISYFAWNKRVGQIADEYESFENESNDLFFSFLEIHDHLGKYCLIDDDDYYRQNYVIKNFKSPFPISWIATSKICEDLECNWDCNEDGSEFEHDFDINCVGAYINNCIGVF